MLVTSDTQTGRQVAPLFPKFPPGPKHLAARIEAARAYAKPDTLFPVFVQSHADTDHGPVVCLWSMPDDELTTGGRFWSCDEGGRITPHVIRLKTDHAPHFGPLVFVVRQGQEIADYNALARQVNRDGMKYDAPVVQIMSWAGDKGRGQFVAILPDEAEAAAE